MLPKRIIPCLDVKDGRVVKGVNFVDFKDAGDPVELAAFYDKEGADELIFLDITASAERKDILSALVKRTAKAISIPFTVGGGISDIEGMSLILKSGADKVSMSTAAVLNPSLISEGANKFGSHSIVVAIDAKRVKNNKGEDRWEVYTHGGRNPTGLDVCQWAKKIQRLGAGEILLTSMDSDGTKSGYDNLLNRAISENVEIPIIASGGAGTPEDMLHAIVEGKVDAVLAASIFHYRHYSVRQVKKYLRKYGISVNL